MFQVITLTKILSGLHSVLHITNHKSQFIYFHLILSQFNIFKSRENLLCKVFPVDI